MTYRIFLLLFTLTLIGCYQTDVREATGNKGELLEKYSVRQIYNGDYIKHGTYQSWYPNGIQKSAGNYLHDKKTGEWKEWYETGKPKSVSHYYNDELQGEQIIYDEAGGMQKRYYQAGNLVEPVPK